MSQPLENVRRLAPRLPGTGHITGKRARVAQQRERHRQVVPGPPAERLCRPEIPRPSLPRRRGPGRRVATPGARRPEPRDEFRPRAVRQPERPRQRAHRTRIRPSRPPPLQIGDGAHGHPGPFRQVLLSQPGGDPPLPEPLSRARSTRMCTHDHHHPVIIPSRIAYDVVGFGKSFRVRGVLSVYLYGTVPCFAAQPHSLLRAGSAAPADEPEPGDETRLDAHHVVHLARDPGFQLRGVALD